MKEVPGFENYYADEDKKLSTFVSNGYFCVKMEGKNIPFGQQQIKQQLIQFGLGNVL